MIGGGSAARVTAVAAAALILSGCPATEPQVVQPPATEPAPPPDPTPTPDDGPPDPAPTPDATIDDVRLALEPVVEGLTEPIFLTAPAGDTRLFVLERPGRVRVLDGGELGTFLDISGAVRTRGEEGLLGMAFHPDYPDDPRFFLHYNDRQGATVLAEHRVSDDPAVADPDHSRVLLRLDQPASNHNGGMLAFGPDGRLYLGLGDGGAAGDRFGHGQRPDTLLGAILRIDVDGGESYAIPPDNPFAGGNGGAPEVWHYGLRNPWRFAFDREEELLYIADVGQNRWEEVNVVPAGDGGLNFGWPIMEATHCFDPPEGCPTEGLVRPVVEYSIQGAACAVIGGFVYRGEAIAGLQGHYLYGDLCAGFVRSFRHEDGQAVDERDWTEQVGAVPRMYSFGTDADGEVYVLSADGLVQRLVPAS